MNAENRETIAIRGIKIKRLSNLLSFLETVFVLVSILCAIFTLNKYNSIDSLNKNYIKIQEEISEIKEASDYLTNNCRQYVMTGEPEYAIAYFEEVNVSKRREKSVAKVYEAVGSIEEETYSYLDEAVEESKRLSQTELHAMALVYNSASAVSGVPVEISGYELPDRDKTLSSYEKRKLASEMVFDKEYSSRKLKIIGLVDSASGEFLELIRNYADECSSQYHLASKILLIMLVMCMLVFGAIVFVMFSLILNPIEDGIMCIESGAPVPYCKAYELNYLVRAFNRLRITNLQEKIKLKYTAERDSLTGLLNRSGYEEVIKYYEESEEPIAFMIVDVDKFKDINDTYGHEVGDIALKRVADLLKESFRDKDYVVRFGGDEFLVIMTDVNDHNKEVIAEKLQRLNKALSFENKDGSPKLSVSVGVAFSQAGFSADLFKQADAALYEVKENGRCGFAFYEKQ